ncbi:unnamed protein product [Bursaphelenchus xylophilus]|uniref:(pine wood nematode) hypothetical protein n=1 Tax=Bursaphelenchus xylophilus TaxID=6326 RepID=A0A1I7STX3_BURXY|nr:unnamed protein product [Bursaphelenchus xylophilus]CAG9107840.1 unnamed protein product [Bursaphelenchus xylophilus]
MSAIDDDEVTPINVEDECVYYGHAMCAACVVRYVGPIEGKSGIYYGVQFNKPLGMNNGSVDGRSYFECPSMHGLFVKNYRLLKVRDTPPPRGGIWSKLLKNLDVGDRVIVEGSRVGIVMTIFRWSANDRQVNKPIMVGVLLDRKRGDCDGSYMGVRHFICEYGFGVFVENFEVRLHETSRTKTGTFGTLSRQPSCRSINSVATDRRPGSCIAPPSRIPFRSPGSTIAAFSPTPLRMRVNGGPRPSVTTQRQNSFTKLEMDSLRNVIDDLSKENKTLEQEQRDVVRKAEESQAQASQLESQLEALKVELDSISFERDEFKSVLQGLGILKEDSTEPNGTSNGVASKPPVLTRVSKVIALLLFRLSNLDPSAKADLTNACDAFIGIPLGNNVGSSLNTISALSKALDLAELSLNSLNKSPNSL